jgi:hypothetical protein
MASEHSGVNDRSPKAWWVAAGAAAIIVLLALFAPPLLRPARPPGGDAPLTAAPARGNGETSLPPEAGAEGPPGSWWEVPESPRDATSEAAAALSAHSYLAGYRPPTGPSGVLMHDAASAQPGYNLLVSGHAPYAALMDNDGEVVHEWTLDPPAGYRVPPQRRFWRRVLLLDDGELLAIFDPFGIVKLAADSALLWAMSPDVHAHHDLVVTDEGLIYVLGKRYRKIPELHERLTFGEDLVVVIDPADGTTRHSFSILEAFENSPYGAEMKERIRVSAATAPGNGWEDFHANTIDVFDGSLAHMSPLFKAGNVISCSPAHNNVFIIDPEAGAVVWNWFGPWRRIHESRVLPGGRLLLFHNNGYQPDGSARSQALEYDLLSRSLLWSYEGTPADPASHFFSGTSSTVERLPNGNTLIVVTESGRAIEVTPEHRVVWEFFNPQRAGDHDELIASLFQLQRIPAHRVDPWLTAADAPARSPEDRTIPREPAR